MSRRLKMATCIFVLLCLITTGMPTFASAQNSDSPLEATWLTLNIPHIGRIYPAGDIDWYKFNASAGSIYVIETYDLSLAMDTLIVLYDRDGARVLAFDDDSGSEPYSSKLTYTFTTTGTYYVTVEHYDTRFGTGTYTILLRTPRPPAVLLSVSDRATGRPLVNASLRMYDVDTYRLLLENWTAGDGTVGATLQSLGYYLLVLSAKGYNDLFGLILLPGEGPFRLAAPMERIRYTGFVVSSALITGIMAPMANNTLKISLYNANTTYSITLLNVTVQFPWSGLYEGRWEKNVTITEGMPVTISPKRSWNYSLPFTAPPDSRAYLNPSTSGFIAFYTQAPAWRTVLNVVEGLGAALRPTLTTIDIDPGLYANQGFLTSIKGLSIFPVTDPNVTAELNDLSSKIGDVNSRLGDVSNTLKGIGSSLEGANEKLEDVSSQLSSSNKKLDKAVTDLGEISLGVSVSNTKMDSLGSQMRSAVTGLGNISLQLYKANSKLDAVNEQILSTQKDTHDLLNLLFGNTQILLYVLTGILALLVAVNVIFLSRISKEISRKGGP